ncbi:hypothetical protein GIB67_030501 [Kingdonia uniflora]|uniref:Uncharacterized protein n=1 Tax=Kingdonia uniflora TaxID=39325 RepID=A0A7J7MC93_9MAGN|nr:hypothetical protein GIB67_030501 [Kingdonia uniflora]
MANFIICSSINPIMRGGIAEKGTVKELLDVIKKKFESSVKGRQYSNLSQLLSLKYDGSENVRSHILKISKLVLTLKELDLTINDTLMVHLAVWFILKSFEMFQVHYQNQEKTWEMNELIAVLVSEEERRKKGKTKLTHLTISMKRLSINSQEKKKFKNQSSANKKKFKSGPGQSCRSGNENEMQNTISSTTTSPVIEYFFCKKKCHVKQDCHSYKN